MIKLAMNNFKQNFENFLKNTDPYKQFEDKHYYLNQESQNSILELQKEKQQVMEIMRELLKKVDTQEAISFSKHGKTILAENDQYYIIQSGIKSPVSTGDILVAGLNGYDLKLDSNVDRLTKKRFILQETTRRIKELYNKQLITAETENLNIRPQDFAVDAYKKIEERNEVQELREKQPGVIAEHMVESFMIKTIADNQDILPFTLEMADVYDDVRSKIDFKLHIKSSFTRGVGVDAGIQFTLNKSKTAHKEKQIEKSKEFMKKNNIDFIDDLILVTVSLDDIHSSIDEWESQGKKRSIAGPTEHWSTETKEKVFTAMLEKLPESLQINPDELWQKIQNTNQKQP